MSILKKTCRWLDSCSRRLDRANHARISSMCLCSHEERHGPRSKENIEDPKRSAGPAMLILASLEFSEVIALSETIRKPVSMVGYLERWCQCEPWVSHEFKPKNRNGISFAVNRSLIFLAIVLLKRTFDVNNFPRNFSRWWLASHKRSTISNSEASWGKANTETHSSTVLKGRSTQAGPAWKIRALRSFSLEILQNSADGPTGSIRLRRVHEGHIVSTYHDIQSKGIEFLRSIYATAGLSTAVHNRNVHT